MRNAYASLLMAALVATSCTPGFVIEGSINDMSDGMLYLEALDSVEYRMKIVDSTRISNGKFKFAFSNDEFANELVLINAPSDNVVVSIFLSNGDVTVDGDLENITELKIKGSKWNDQFQSFYRSVPEKSTLSSLENEIKSMYGVKDEDRRSELVRQYRNVIYEQNNFIKRYISENANNPVGACLLLKNLDIFSFDEADTLSAHMYREMSDNKYVRVVVNTINNKRAENEARKHIEVGKKAPDFNLPDADGNMVSLQSFRGKYVLLNFWDLDSEACRENNSTLTEAYKKFSKCEFVIVSVSLNEKIEPWLRIVTEEKLSGIQLIDTANIVGNAYLVYDKTLPNNVLIDSDGYIVSKDIHGPGIFEEIIEHLKTDDKQ